MGSLGQDLVWAGAISLDVISWFPSFGMSFNLIKPLCLYLSTSQLRTISLSDKKPSEPNSLIINHHIHFVNFIRPRQASFQCLPCTYYNVSSKTYFLVLKSVKFVRIGERKSLKYKFTNWIWRSKLIRKL